jgi:hypothetical protein
MLATNDRKPVWERIPADDVRERILARAAQRRSGRNPVGVGGLGGGLTQGSPPAARNPGLEGRGPVGAGCVRFLTGAGGMCPLPYGRGSAQVA